MAEMMMMMMMMMMMFVVYKTNILCWIFIEKQVYR